ncbi:hypothetical protein GQ602_007305 [Ophiocordyceps camponoti-floridani]|uniref:Uncharacterized protein n=1 Tax=Ophiocordyceps camponoti-floridani TaxID=2030778 RepID=A0A8H4Q115_9HYPO|nr:hypothetical protein GQ602_007305 [Ophiocordyceps camponoti-floridani]
MKLSAALAATLIGQTTATPIPTQALSARGLPGAPSNHEAFTPPGVTRAMPRGPVNVPDPYGARSVGNPGFWVNPPHGMALRADGRAPVNIRFPQQPNFIPYRQGMVAHQRPGGVGGRDGAFARE